MPVGCTALRSTLVYFVFPYFLPPDFFHFYILNTLRTQESASPPYKRRDPAYAALGETVGAPPLPPRPQQLAFNRPDHRSSLSKKPNRKGGGFHPSGSPSDGSPSSVDEQRTRPNGPSAAL
eukprot:scaffold284726_cov17-Tisochrysis_lutea.AAC.1